MEDGDIAGIFTERDCMRQRSEAAKLKALQLIDRMRDKYPVQRHG